MSQRVEPIELCLESLDLADDEHPYVRCVAVAGGKPGLGLTAEGTFVWLENDLAALLIWVSLDNRLMLLRQNESPRVRLTRAERFLDLPASKPVVTMQDDVITLGGHAFRVHVHGVASCVEPPLRLPLRRAQNWVAGTLAAASMLACHTNPRVASLAAGGAPSRAASTEISAPSPATGGTSQVPPTAATGGQGSVNQDAGGTGGTQGSSSSKTKPTPRKPTPPIEIRRHPPMMMLDDSKL